MPSNRGFLPLECWRGTKPSQAANWRPVVKVVPSPRLATNALAVSGPDSRDRFELAARGRGAVPALNLLFKFSSWAVQLLYVGKESEKQLPHDLRHFGFQLHQRCG